MGNTISSLLFGPRQTQTQTQTQTKVPAARTVTVSQADANQPIKLNKGDSLIVSLTANETTPYKWHHIPGGLVCASSQYRSDANPDGRLGVGGHREFRFETKGIKSGTYSLTFAHNPYGVGDVIVPESSLQRFSIVVK